MINLVGNYQDHRASRRRAATNRSQRRKERALDDRNSKIARNVYSDCDRLGEQRQVDMTYVAERDLAKRFIRQVRKAGATGNPAIIKRMAKQWLNDSGRSIYHRDSLRLAFKSLGLKIAPDSCIETFLDS